MPWTTKDVDRFKKGLDAHHKQEWVNVANASLAACLKAGGKQSDCEAKAIKIASGIMMEEAVRFGGKKRSDLKDTDFVFSDERAFPVMIAGDVPDAVSSWGRYRGKHSFDDFKAKLTALAKRKGFSSSLPDSWKAKEAMHIVEKGRVYNKTNESYLRQAYTAIKKALEALSADPETDDEETDAEEASGWSTADLAACVSREMREKISRDAYLLDIYPEEGLAIYQTGWGGGIFQCEFTCDDTGVCEFGDPVEVSRKVTYVATSDQEITPPVDMSMTMAASESSIDLETEPIQLVETAVNPAGETTVKIIEEGWGSSGYYPRDVLVRDGSKVFTKGTKMFWDHQTAKEEAERPEGSLDRFAAVLTEDAQWRSDTKYGSGLFAKAKVNEAYKGAVNDLAPHIGVSIRATGKAKIGEIDGKRGPIIEAITRAKSIDFVTTPGAGGQVLELFESYRNKLTEDNEMGITKDELKELIEEGLKPIRDQVARQNNLLEAQKATNAVNLALGKYRGVLPSNVLLRLQQNLSANFPLTESGAYDPSKHVELIETAIKDEIAYLQSFGLFGQVNVGSGTTPQGVKPEDYDKQLAEAFKAITEDDKVAALAVKGRD